MRCYLHLCCIPGCLDGGEPSIHSDPTLSDLVKASRGTFSLNWGICC
uniref:Uncharacterized protein n=1 Tax=Anguilla anguilla TaxID=7936 RepID=A0A0E9SDH3_ANGAN